MTSQLVSKDTETLPGEMLALAKAHIRVDGSAEDSFLKSVLARAIARFEAVNNCAVNATSVIWTPAKLDFVGDQITARHVPVMSFTVMSGLTDLTADYSLLLKHDTVSGIPIQLFKGVARDGLVFTLQCGMGETLPPDVEDIVLRHAAHLFNHREILLPGREYVAPDLRVNATWWMPRV